jgi:hypothetical protein
VTRRLFNRMIFATAGSADDPSEAGRAVGLLAPIGFSMPIANRLGAGRTATFN